MKYSIADLEKLSGVRAHTIRIWEQRYKLLEPQRTSTNIRYYNDDQVKRLLNTVTLVNNGIKISKVSKMTPEETGAFLDQVENTNTESALELYVIRMISSGMEFDETVFDKTFTTCITKYGVYDTFKRIVYPVLRRTGLMWGKDEMNPAQEHFISNILRQKLITAIDGLPIIQDDKEKWLLFLPQEEDHEVGLLLSSYLLRSNGKALVYLGQRVPEDSLRETISAYQPHNLLTFLVHMQRVEDAQEYVDNLSYWFTGRQAYVAGNDFLLDKIKWPENVAYLKSLDEFLNKIEQ